MTRTNKLLLLKVIPRRGANWQPVTGSVDLGENWADAAKRELLEETGLALEVQDLNIQYEFEDRFERKVCEKAYLAIMDQEQDVPIDPIEHTDFVWRNFDEILPETMPYLNQFHAFEKARELL